MGLDLGLSDADLDSHCAWDPGALDLAQALALRWGVPLVAGTVTRLVVDLNRCEAGAIHPVAFGLAVPGNQGLSEDQRQRRLSAFHGPYRRSLYAEAARSTPCRHLSVHSFTPDLDPVGRDFDVGLLFDPARPAEVAWAAWLHSTLVAHDLRVRDNQPYAGTEDAADTWLRTLLRDPDYAGLELELNLGVPGLGARVLAALG